MHECDNYSSVLFLWGENPDSSHRDWNQNVSAHVLFCAYCLPTQTAASPPPDSVTMILKLHSDSFRAQEQTCVEHIYTGPGTDWISSRVIFLLLQTFDKNRGDMKTGGQGRQAETGHNCVSPPSKACPLSEGERQRETWPCSVWAKNTPTHTRHVKLYAPFKNINAHWQPLWEPSLLANICHETFPCMTHFCLLVISSPVCYSPKHFFSFKPALSLSRKKNNPFLILLDLVHLLLFCFASVCCGHENVGRLPLWTRARRESPPGWSGSSRWGCSCRTPAPAGGCTDCQPKTWSPWGRYLLGQGRGQAQGHTHTHTQAGGRRPSRKEEKDKAYLVFKVRR